MTKDPAPVAILAARIMRAYPSLSPYSAASLATELSAIERAQRRHAERCCSGADGGYVRKAVTGRATGPNRTSEWNSYAIVHDPDAEQRAAHRIQRTLDRWQETLAARLAHVTNCRCGAKLDADRRCPNARCWAFNKDQVGSPIVRLEGDPRGPVLLLRLPGEAEAVAV